LVLKEKVLVLVLTKKSWSWKNMEVLVLVLVLTKKSYLHQWTIAQRVTQQQHRREAEVNTGMWALPYQQPNRHCSLIKAECPTSLSTFMMNAPITIHQRLGLQGIGKTPR